jgi:intermembrane space import and assembly protein 40
MSYCQDLGKDKVIFASREDHDTPSSVSLPEDEERPGLVLPNGDINWACPCLGGMASGPCGFEFRDAFSCFHYSQEENKGVECIDKFSAMSLCMSEYPALYPKSKENNEELDMALAEAEAMSQNETGMKGKEVEVAMNGDTSSGPGPGSSGESRPSPSPSAGSGSGSGSSSSSSSSTTSGPEAGPSTSGHKKS